MLDSDHGIAALLRQLILQEAQFALGCSEPGMVALAAAHASRLTGEPPQKIWVTVSPAVLKNGRAVGLPGSRLTGIGAAAALGAACASPHLGLQVLSSLTPDQHLLAQSLISSGGVSVSTDPSKEALYVEAVIQSPNHLATALIRGCHSSLHQASLDGKPIEVLVQTSESIAPNCLQQFPFEDVVGAALSMDVTGLEFIEQGARQNLLLAQEAIAGTCKEGLIGLSSALSKVSARFTSGLAGSVRGSTAAAVSARMGGTIWPVLTCAGSGNQGLLVSIPLCLAWDEAVKDGAEGTKGRSLARCLLMAHSVNLYLKSYTGEISALCGAVTGGAGVAAAICWMYGGEVAQIDLAVLNVIGGLCGMLCDGAKGSCALKISCAACEAVTAGMLALDGIGLSSENGIISPSVDETARRLGALTRQVLNRADDLVISVCDTIGGGSLID